MQPHSVTTKMPEVNQRTSWTMTDTNWCLAIFGTAVGAGILFLPINAGIGGIWPLIALSILLIPLTFITHRSVIRFCLSAKEADSDFNDAANEHLGKRKGLWVTIAYFSFIFPIVMAYGIGLTNTVESLLTDQFGWPAPDRWLLTLILILTLVGIVICGEKVILKATAILAYPLGAILIFISIYLIPQWNLAQFSQPITTGGVIKGFLSTLPILVFALAYIPVCSAIAQSYRKKIAGPDECRKKVEKITAIGTALLMLMTLFFTFSCVLTLSPEELLAAKQNNISVMTLLALTSSKPWFVAVTAIVGITAISSSFLGYYLGAREGLLGLIKQWYFRSAIDIPKTRHLNWAVNLFYILTLWLVSYLNLSVIDIMGAIAAPLMAVILYLLPVYAVRTTKALKLYRAKVDVLTFAIGLICIASYIIAIAL